MATVGEEYIVGFLCPICKSNFESPKLLLVHYASHAEDHSEPVTIVSVTPRSMQYSVKKIFERAKELHNTSFERVFGRSITNIRQSLNEGKKGKEGALEVYKGEVKLVTRTHTDYLAEVRSEKIKEHGKETDRIMINLEKYLNNPKKISQVFKHEDEIEVKTCSVCKKSFKLTRKKRHCKLCTVALCNNCSVYVDADFARFVVIVNKCEVPDADTTLKKPVKPLRHCENCGRLLKVIVARHVEENPEFVDIYNEMQNLKRQMSQFIVSYTKIYQNLIQGKTIHDLSQAIKAKDLIGKRGKEIALIGKRIAEIPVQVGSLQAKIQQNIQRATNEFIKVAIIETNPEDLKTEYQLQIKPLNM